MAAIFSLTVKKSDGVTDIVYDAIAGSGGDSSPAFYRQDTGATATLPVGLRPTLKLMTRWNTARTARICEYEYVAPYATQDSTTTKWSASDRVVAKGVFTAPQAIPASNLKEAAYQLFNLLTQVSSKDTMWTGFAPT